LLRSIDVNYFVKKKKMIVLMIEIIILIGNIIPTDLFHPDPRDDPGLSLGLGPGLPEGLITIITGIGLEALRVRGDLPLRTNAKSDRKLRFFKSVYNLIVL